MNAIDVLKDMMGFRKNMWRAVVDDNAVLPFGYTKDILMSEIAALTDVIKQLEWVPVTERTPDNDDKVIVYVPDYSIKVSKGETDHYAGYTAVGHYLDGKWHQPHVGYPGPVTMWKPWPKEPEGKTSTQQMLDEVIDHIMEV